MTENRRQKTENDILQPSVALLIKKNFKYHGRPRARGSDDFSGYHDRIFGLGKFKGHRDFLSDRQWHIGFNENSGTTYVLDRCIEFGIRRFAIDDDRMVFFK